MSETLGIGVLCYYGLKDTQACLASIRASITTPCRVLVFDNSENDEVGAWVSEHAIEAFYVRSPANVGCARARNHMAEWFAARGIRHFVLMDQDVTFVAAAQGKPDALAEMRAVFARHKDTGIVSWLLFTKQMSPAHYLNGNKSGVVPEAPGACSMFSLDCVKAIGGWEPRMHMYKFDTLAAFKAAKAGFKTRLVTPDAGLVRHTHAHQGIKRHARWRAEQARSRTIFAEQVKRHGLSVPAGL